MKIDSNLIYLAIAIAGFLLRDVLKPIWELIISLFKKNETEKEKILEKNEIITQNDLLKFEQQCDTKYVSSSRFDSELNEVRGELRDIQKTQIAIDKATSLTQKDVAYILDIIKEIKGCK